MSKTPRTALIALLASGFALGQKPEPRLILVVSIDQMRFDYLTRFAPLFRGGFKTLLDRGAVFTNAAYRHANTETGPGHAVILSGRHPSSSGIVANLWWDPLLRKSVAAAEDPVHAPVGGRGGGYSPANLLGFTVGDKIRYKWPDSKVVGLAAKERSAILPAGRRATAAYWFEIGCGCFITSTYYTREAPAWLVQFNRRRPADRFFPAPWARLLPDAALYEKFAGPDDFPGEWDLKDTTFPHQHRGRPPEQGYYDNLRRTPFADEIVLEVALEILKAHDLGADASPDVLAVSFSGGDVVGHTYGPNSQETMDVYLRLDLLLQKLFGAVEARAKPGQSLVILTADHGVLPLVEWLKKQGVEARRLRAQVLRDAVTATLKKRYPAAGELIAFFDNPHFTFDLPALQKHGLRRSEVEQTAIKALMDTGAVAAVYTHGDLSSDQPSKDPYIGLFRNSFFASRSPHLMVLPKRNYYIDDYPGGTGHGTAYEYDRQVPIVWLGPGIKPARHGGAAGPEDIAPTLARMLGIDYPLEPDARLLTEVLR